MNEANAIYHEKQSLELCAIHALNNLFQGVAFTKATMDKICSTLSPETRLMNPHRSWLGLGNYDVNVLMTALQEKDCSAIWWDKRKDLADLCLHNIVGFIVNIPSEPKIGPIKIPFIQRKHWISIKEIGGAYYNLDSKLNSPEIIGDSNDLLAFLRKSLEDKEKELLLVVSNSVESDGTYINISAS